jgi:hypothetical protein
MQIQTLVEQVNSQRLFWGQPLSPPAAQEEITRLAAEFRETFAHALPKAYTTLLASSNGVHYNGLTIWPAYAHGPFDEDLIEANLVLRESLSEEYLYFAQRKEELFVYAPRLLRFLAIEIGAPVPWASFRSCEELLAFALERSIPRPTPMAPVAVARC